MAEIEIKTQINGKETIYFPITKKWRYDGVDESTISKINPDLAKQINKELAKSVQEYQDRLETEEKQRIAKILEQKNQELKAFKELVLPMIPSGYVALFDDKPSQSTNVRQVSIIKNKIDATICYDGTVHSPGSFYSHSTTMPWERSFQYKRQRFSTIEKAIKNAIQNIDEQIKHDEYKQKRNEAIATTQNDIKSQLNAIGIDFAITEKWHSSGRHSGYTDKRNTAMIHISGIDKQYETKVMIAGDALASSDNQNKRLSIHNIRIKGIFSLEQFKQIAELIKQINPKCD